MKNISQNLSVTEVTGAVDSVAGDVANVVGAVVAVVAVYTDTRTMSEFN